MLQMLKNISLQYNLLKNLTDSNDFSHSSLRHLSKSCLPWGNRWLLSYTFMTLKNSLEHKINLQKNIESEPSWREFWEIRKKLIIWTDRVTQYLGWSIVTLSKRPFLCSTLTFLSDMVHLAILGATAPFKGKDKKSSSAFFIGTWLFHARMMKNSLWNCISQFTAFYLPWNCQLKLIFQF